MTPDDKRQHARELLMRQREILADCKRYLPQASPQRYWIGEAERLNDLAEETLYTMGEMMKQQSSKGGER